MTVTLDKRLASALNADDTSAATFSKLIIEIDHALELNQKALEAEEIRLLDITNPDPEKSKAAVDKIKLSEQRLKATLPVL